MNRLSYLTIEVEVDTCHLRIARSLLWPAGAEDVTVKVHWEYSKGCPQTDVQPAEPEVVEIEVWGAVSANGLNLCNRQAISVDKIINEYFCDDDIEPMLWEILEGEQSELEELMLEKQIEDQKYV